MRKQLQFVPNTVAAALSAKQAGRAALLIHLNNRTQAIDEISLQYIAGAIHEAKERKLDIITRSLKPYRSCETLCNK